MRAVGYLRTTRAELRQEEAVLREQRSRIEQYVADQGWELVAVYEDPASDESGASGRSGLISMLDGLADFDKVVVVGLRRLRPSARATFDLIRQLRQAGVDLVSLDEKFDTGAESGAAVPAILAYAGAWEKGREQSAGWRPENLRKPGFEPLTVIDVGVGPGTPPLYRAFPDSHFVLIEPLKEFLPDLERLQGELDAEYVLTAVGAKEGSAKIRVNKNGLIFSSLLRYLDPLPEQPFEEREIPITTLDRLLEERKWQGPFGLKIDTEGFEHQVIEGGSRLLAETQFVIAEVVMAKRYEGGYTFAEFIGLMDSHGFRLCDVLDLPKLAAFRELRYVNALFRRAEDAAE